MVKCDQARPHGHLNLTDPESEVLTLLSGAVFDVHFEWTRLSLFVWNRYKRVGIADATWSWTCPKRDASYCKKPSRRAFSTSGPCATRNSMYSGPKDAVSLSSATLEPQSGEWVFPSSQIISLYRIRRRLTTSATKCSGAAQLLKSEEDFSAQ